MVKNLPTVERSTKIRFGKNALEDQAENTIVFNASNTELQATQSGAVYLTPIRFREDFSDPEIVLLMYDKSTGEITESGSSASTAVEPPFQSVSGFGNTTTYTMEFNNPSTSFFALSNAEFSNTISIGSLTQDFIPIVGSNKMLEDSKIRLNNGSTVINSNLEVVGDITFSGNSYVIESQSLNIKDKIVGISNNNPSNNYDGGLIIENVGHNVGLIHHGDEDRFSMGYTQNVASDNHILHDSNVFLLDVLGNLQVQNNITVTETGTFDHLVADSITIKTDSFHVDSSTSNVGIGTSTPAFNLDVHGTSNVGTLTALSGAFTGPVSGTSYTGGAISGTTGTFTGGITGASYAGGEISGTTGTFTGGITGASYAGGEISGTTGTLSSTLSSGALTATSAQINGVVNTTGNLTVNTDAILVDATNKKVGIGKTPTANLDVVGNINSSTGIISASGGITATTGLFSGDGGLISNVQVSSVTGDLALGTATSGDYVQSMSGGDGITVTSGSGESSTPSVAVDLKANGGLVIESTEVAVDLSASAITGTLAVADGGTGVTTSTGSTNVVLSDSPTLTGTLTAATANFSGDLSAVGGAFSGAVTGASYSGGAISGTTGTFSGTLSSAGFTATTGQFNGTLASTNDFTVGVDKLVVDVSTSSVGIGMDSPAFNLDVNGTANVGVLTTTKAATFGATKTFVVRADGGAYYIDDVIRKPLVFHENQTYIFDLSHSSLASGAHPFSFSTGGTDGSGVAYSTGITPSGTAGTAGAKKTFVVPPGTTSPIYYYCSIHGGMGSTITIATTPEVIVSGNLDTVTATLSDDLSVGVDKLFVDVSASGVGIGTTTPAFNLDVHGTANVGTFTATTANLGGLTTTTGTLTDDLIVGVNKLVVDVSASSVGIGTATPAFNLDVHGTSNVGTLTATTAIVNSDIASTSATTGSVIVTGGIGLTGNVYASGNVYAQSEQAGLSHLGRAKIGFDGTNTDEAAYSHEDYMSSTAYALKQTATSGDTHLNTPTGGHIGFSVNNTEVGKFTGLGDFLVDTDTLYVDASQHCVGIETTTPHANLHVSGNVYVTEEITSATNVNAAKVYSSSGMVINTGSVCKKFYSYKGTIPNGISASDAAIKLTFSTNIFYAKIVAHLIEADNEFSNMSLEVGGGHRDGDNSPTQLAIATGSISVFGNTSTNPWDTQVATTTTTVTLKPSATTSTTDSNSGNVDYNLFIEYISPDSTTGKLASIHGYSGSSADQELVTFNY